MGSDGYEMNANNVNHVYQGHFEQDTNDVVWKPLEPLKKAKTSYIIFKMKDNVYVAGGLDCRHQVLLCCDRLNLKENTWFSCKHSLPYPLDWASVVVSDDESFAVITGRRKANYVFRKRPCYSDSIIVFTEKEGFKVMPTGLLNKRFAYVSILI